MRHLLQKKVVLEIEIFVYLRIEMIWFRQNSLSSILDDLVSPMPVLVMKINLQTIVHYQKHHHLDPMDELKVFQPLATTVCELHLPNHQ